LLTAVTGINWGDEGKGRMVDLLSSDYDIVVRYQGGNNAGHTVVNDKGKFILNLLPSGILRDTTVNVLGGGMVIDIEHLSAEIDALREKQILVSSKNLKISDRAVISMPYHKLLDVLEEERLKDRQYGSTRRGIAPAYSDKYMKKALLLGDLLEPETLREKVINIVEWKNLSVHNGYGYEKIDAQNILKWLFEYGERIKEYICDTSRYLEMASDCGRRIMFEAQLGALRDIDFGIYPYTSSSSTIASYALIGAGIPSKKLDKVIGIMKAYSSCVGEGPFACEMYSDEAAKLREAGNEYGAATGRPRRVGGFDAVASRYGVHVQGADEIALTKLDVLSYMDKIPVCVAYDVDGHVTKDFPAGDKLKRAKPIFEYLDGFRADISKCRNQSELPAKALAYVRFIERCVGCPIKYISVGQNREDIILRQAARIQKSEVRIQKSE